MNDANCCNAFSFCPLLYQVDHIKAEVDAIVEPIIEKGEEIEKEIQEQEGKGQPISQKQ